MSDETTEKSIRIARYKRRCKYFTENLGNGIGLDMVLIPGGTFLMGTSEDELGSKENERPQHEVIMPSFFMGQYAITQAQWRVVASYPQIEQELEPDPSQFKGDNHPVENVSWHDATEFCKRLSTHTRRQYKLPSEAQWEYTCRAGTTTPFHFGEILTLELANYNGSPQGESQKQTTEVGSFPANEWGLYDMHGNVWEWCEDDWHPNYKGAPNDGTAWIDENRTDTRIGLLRGGSWFYNAIYCRSAFRNCYNRRDFISTYVGFRVVCLFAKTP